MTVKPPLLGVVAFAVASHVTGQENLIRNGSFEDFVAVVEGEEAPKAWALKSPWYAKPKEKGLSPASLDKTIVHGGTRAICLTGEGNRGILWQIVSEGFRPGDRIELSGYAKLRDLNRGLAWLRIEFKQEGKYLGAMATHSERYQRGTSTWQFLKTQGTVPEGATLLQVFLSTSEPNTGQVWFDDVDVRNLSAPVEAAPQAKTLPVAEGTVHEGQSPDTGRTFVGLIPIDAFGSSEVAWRSGHWGRAPEMTNVVEVRQEEGANLLRVKFTAGRTFIVRKWEYTKPWTALCFRARLVAGGGRLSVLIGTWGGHFQIHLPRLSSEWRDYALPVETFRLDRKPSTPLSGERPVAAIRLFAHRPMTVDVGPMRVAVPPQLGIAEAYTDQFANFFEPGCSPQARVSLFNSHEDDTTSTLSCKVRNYRGEVIHADSRDCMLKACCLAEERFALPTLNVGYYSCAFALATDKIHDEGTAGIVVAPPRPAGGPLRSFVGTSIFGDISELSVRMWMHRAEIPMNGFWRQYHAGATPVADPSESVKLQLCKRHHLKPVGFYIIHPNHDRLSRKALLKSKEDPNKWVYDTAIIEDYIYKVASCYKDDIKVWSVAGECNLFAGRLEGARDAYVEAALAAIGGIRRAVPDAKVYGIGVSGSDPYQDWTFAKYAWKTLGPHLDGVYSDNYPSGWTVQEGLRAATPESFVNAHLRNMLDHMGPGKTIGVEEAGYQLDPKLPIWHPLTRRRAEYAARVALLAAGIPRCDEYHWYTLGKGSVTKPWGLCLTAGPHLNPDPGVATYSTVARMLWDATEPIKVDLHKEIWSYVYRKPQGAMAVLWSTAKDEISFVFDGLPQFAAYDADGSTVAAKDQHIFLSGSPCYVCVDGATPEELVAKLEAARFSLPPVKIAFILDWIDKVKMVIASQTGSGALAGAATVRVTLANGEAQAATTDSFGVSPDRVMTKELAIKPLPAGSRTTITVEGEFATSANLRTEQKQYFRLWPVKKLSTRPAIDADLSEYAALPPIVLDKAEHVTPPDAVGVHQLWKSAADLSVKAWTAWDDETFYFAAEVTDPVHVQDRTKSSIWAHDCVHLGFDMLHDTLSPEFSGKGGHDGQNDFEVGLALTKEGPQAYEWYSGSQPTRGLETNAKVAVRREGNKTYYELAKPWEDLDRYEPAAGRVIGFGFVVMNSNDGSTARYWLEFTGGICGGKDPSRYDSFVLVE